MDTIEVSFIQRSNCYRKLSFGKVLGVLLERHDSALVYDKYNGLFSSETVVILYLLLQEVANLVSIEPLKQTRWYCMRT